MVLTPKQQSFVDEYLLTFNATQAAIEAGYSEKTAYSQGARLLKNVEIAKAIQDFLNTHAMRAEEVLFHLTEIARGDFGEISDSAGFLDMEKARKGRKTRLIKRTKQRTTTSEDFEAHEVEVEMYDRLTALGLLAKYHNLVNRVIVQDWRSEAIEAIRRNEIEYYALAEEMGIDLATELFISAGVPVNDVRTLAESQTEE